VAASYTTGQTYYLVKQYGAILQHNLSCVQLEHNHIMLTSTTVIDEVSQVRPDPIIDNEYFQDVWSLLQLHTNGEQ
jgi:hypothetical protein